MFNLFGDKKTFFSFAIIGFLLGSGGLGSTQQTAPSMPSAYQETISDGELRAFVKAYVDNQKIRQKYEPTLEHGPAKESRDSGASQPRSKKIAR